MNNTNKNLKFNTLAAVGNPIYPLAFLTSRNRLFLKSNNELSGDGTPRYVPNPKASATYCLQNCMKDYTPIYDINTLEQFVKC